MTSGLKEAVRYGLDGTYASMDKPSEGAITSRMKAPGNKALLDLTKYRGQELGREMKSAAAGGSLIPRLLLGDSAFQDLAVTVEEVASKLVHTLLGEVFVENVLNVLAKVSLSMLAFYPR